MDLITMGRGSSGRLRAAGLGRRSASSFLFGPPAPQLLTACSEISWCFDRTPRKVLFDRAQDALDLEWLLQQIVDPGRRFASLDQFLGGGHPDHRDVA